MPRCLKIVLGCLLAIVVATCLTSCGNSSGWIEKIESSEALPLWQKVTAIALATLVSEDIASIAAGMLASRGAITVTWAIIAAFLGIFVGDVALFALGRAGGITLLRRIPFRWFVKEHQIHQAETLFQQNGAKLIFSSRLLPGSRLPIYAAAGVLNYPFWRFALFMGIAGALSAILLVLLAWKMGEVVFEWLRIYEAYAIPVFITVLLLIWLTVKILEILATKRSRLVFLARCRKLYQRVSAAVSRS